MTQEKREEAWKRVEEVVKRHGMDPSWTDLLKQFYTFGYNDGHKTGLDEGYGEAVKRDDK